MDYLREFWGWLRDYAETVLPEFRCWLNQWSHDDIPVGEPTFYVEEPGNSSYLLIAIDGGPCRAKNDHPSEEVNVHVNVLVFAIEHRKEFIDGTIEGVETFDEYIQYCAYSLTGAGFVKSGNKT